MSSIAAYDRVDLGMAMERVLGYKQHHNKTRIRINRNRNRNRNRNMNRTRVSTFSLPNVYKLSDLTMHGGPQKQSVLRMCKKGHWRNLTAHARGRHFKVQNRLLLGARLKTGWRVNIGQVVFL